jgi:hypothetical protein
MRPVLAKQMTDYNLCASSARTASLVVITNNDVNINMFVETAGNYGVLHVLRGGVGGGGRSNRVGCNSSGKLYSYIFFETLHTELALVFISCSCQEFYVIIMCIGMRLAVHVARVGDEKCINNFGGKT